MKQVKHLATENEKGKGERAYLRKALSLSQYPHTTTEDNRGSAGLQPITPSKNKQPAIIEKNALAKAPTQSKHTQQDQLLRLEKA